MTCEELIGLLAPMPRQSIVWLWTGNASHGKAKILKVFRDTRAERNEVAVEFDAEDFRTHHQKRDDLLELEDEVRRLKREVEYLESELERTEEGRSR